MIETVSSKDPNLSKKVLAGRKRTHILHEAETQTIVFLVQRMPKFVTSNILTGIGLFGTFLVFVGFTLAHFFAPFYLLLCPLGLIINWFGDSLDGRLAYFRNTPRKWFGFSLDIIMDWVGTVMIGMGYFVYAPQEWKIIAFIFVVLYGWAMIITQLRYKVTDQYTIDSGLIGPTEIRIILALIISLEFFIHNSLHYIAGVICIGFFFVNIHETRNLLKLGDQRDARERGAKQKEASLVGDN